MAKTLETYLKNHRALAVQLSNYLNNLGTAATVLSRKIINIINEDTCDKESHWFITQRPILQKKIKSILDRQKKEYQHYAYFYDHPYQGLGILGVFGERPTEERFDLYQLDKFITSDSRILDLGCNCGFVGIYTAFRKGCHVTGIDINPYAIEIGQACVDYLNISDKVNLMECRVQDLDKSLRFNAVFSFATHWTDDENYRIDLYDHLKMIHSLLEEGGLLFFESHCADVGHEPFYETMKKAQGLFSTISSRNTDANSRHYYVLQKNP